MLTGQTFDETTVVAMPDGPTYAETLAVANPDPNPWPDDEFDVVTSRWGWASSGKLLAHVEALEILQRQTAAVQMEIAAELRSRLRQPRTRDSESAGADTDRPDTDRPDTDRPEAAATRSIGAEYGLARKVSPRIGSTRFTTAVFLTKYLPAVVEALMAGSITESTASGIYERARWLCEADLALLNLRLSNMLARPGGERTQLERVTALVLQLDPESAHRRRVSAAANRRVTCRATLSEMANLTAHLPDIDAITCMRALQIAVTEARAAGDPRTDSQIMADTLTSALTGRPATHAPRPETEPVSTAPDSVEPDSTDPDSTDPDSTDTDSTDTETAETAGAMHDTAGCGVPIALNLVMPLDAFLGGETSARLDGHTISAQMARRLLTDPNTPISLRRLLTDPETGQLVQMDQKSRVFRGQLRDFVRQRDQRCLMPWCDAPIRHIDHITPYRRSGHTHASDAQGLCAWDNYLKELYGWAVTATPVDGRPDLPPVITITTPAGMVYTTTPAEVCPTAYPSYQDWFAHVSRSAIPDATPPSRPPD